ncbi:hypothetical protein I3843_01G184300 [Carya illinoinensis]|nr:hypothetical protein I3843_01G184300 [Carya illinoinensis]
MMMRLRSNSRLMVCMNGSSFGNPRMSGGF